jgi:hypothetical protein
MAPWRGKEKESSSEVWKSASATQRWPLQMQHNDPGFGPRGFLANWAPHILGKNRPRR